MREGLQRQEQGIQIVETAVKSTSLSSLPTILRTIQNAGEFAACSLIKQEPIDPRVKIEPGTETTTPEEAHDEAGDAICSGVQTDQDQAVGILGMLQDT